MRGQASSSERKLLRGNGHENGKEWGTGEREVGKSTAVKTADNEKITYSVLIKTW